jgi:hypothetical protein
MQETHVMNGDFTKSMIERVNWRSLSLAVANLQLSEQRSSSLQGSRCTGTEAAIMPSAISCLSTLCRPVKKKNFVYRTIVSNYSVGLKRMQLLFFEESNDLNLTKTYVKKH